MIASDNSKHNTVVVMLSWLTQNLQAAATAAAAAANNRLAHQDVNLLYFTKH